MSRFTAVRAAASAVDGCGVRGFSPPVRSSASSASSATRPQLVYVRLPMAMSATPCSGSQRMCEPNPGRPPL